MTPEALAEVHRACFPGRPWSAAWLTAVCSNPMVKCLTTACENGFALVQTVAGEAEVLTIAVHPQARRQGLATQLMQQLLAQNVERVFLEVAEDNAAARSLYSKLGFQQVGHRKGYYARAQATPIDALILSRLAQ